MRHWIPSTYNSVREQARQRVERKREQYPRSAEFSTTRVARVALAAGREWRAEDYEDLTPAMPDLSTHATRQDSVYQFTKWKTGQPICLRVGDMTLDDIEFHEAKVSSCRNAYEQAWYTAFNQELAFRADVHAYETQGQGRFNGAG